MIQLKLSNLSRSLCMQSVICCAVLAVPPLPAAADSSSYAACPQCGSQAAAWSEGEFDQVVLVGASAAQDNIHPAKLAPEPLAKILATLRYKTAGGMQPVLDAEGAARLARGLAAGLGKAAERQDVLFLATTGDAKNLFATRYGSSGRAFIDKNGLNLLFAEARIDFIDQYRGTKRVRAFDFGSRSAASSVVLMADNLSQPRADWVVVPLAVLRDQQQAGVAPVMRDEQYYAAQEARLRALKRLRDQNLIDEQDFQTKRGEILKAW